jgi:phosphotransferase system HPr-like phosphotransfer protein
VQQFDICLRSFAEVQDFVSLATVQPFQVMVGNDHQQVNAKSFMGMLSLDFSQPVQVKADCSSEVFNNFRQAVLASAK